MHGALFIKQCIISQNILFCKVIALGTNITNFLSCTLNIPKIKTIIFRARLRKTLAATF
jgi:hypothetical protein